MARIYFIFSSVSTSSKSFLISASLPIPKARNKAVAAIFLLRSILTEITPLGSVSNSSQAPREGIIFDPKKFLTPLERKDVKKAPGLLISWEITTRSTPLMKKVPRGVIKGKSPKYNSC